MHRFPLTSLIPLVLTLAVAGSACEPPEPPPPPVPGEMTFDGDVLVTVDGDPIKQGLIDVITQPLDEAQRKALTEDANQRRAFLEQVVVGELMYRKALEAGLHEDPEVSKALAMAQREILANALMDRQGRKAVSEAKIKEKYDSMAVQFQQPNARIHHLIVDDAELASRITAELQGGADFGKLAAQYSKDPQARQNGGDLGWVVRPPLPELAKAFDEAPEGEIIGPIESRMGFHVLRIDARRPNTPLEEVAPLLEDEIRKEAMSAFRTDAVMEAKIVYTNPADAPKKDAGGAQLQMGQPGMGQPGMGQPGMNPPVGGELAPSQPGADAPTPSPGG